MFIDIVESNPEELEAMALKLGLKALAIYSEKTLILPTNSKVKFISAGPKKAQLVLSKSVAKDTKILFQSANAPMRHSEYKELERKKIALLFPLSEIIHEKDKPHYLENLVRHIKLCRKHGVIIVIATLAQDKYALRSELELAALYRSIGMTTSQANQGLSFIALQLGLK